MEIQGRELRQNWPRFQFMDRKQDEAKIAKKGFQGLRAAGVDFFRPMALLTQKEQNPQKKKKRGSRNFRIFDNSAHRTRKPTRTEERGIPRHFAGLAVPGVSLSRDRVARFGRPRLGGEFYAPLIQLVGSDRLNCFTAGLAVHWLDLLTVLCTLG